MLAKFSDFLFDPFKVFRAKTIINNLHTANENDKQKFTKILQTKKNLRNFVCKFENLTFVEEPHNQLAA